MTSNKRELNSEIITTFMLNTCRLCPKPGKYNVQAAVRCAKTATDHPFDDTETHNIPLLTGSVAEFYIEPMLPHVGDIDVMFHDSTELAIPRGQSPPSQLSAEFHNWVRVLEIIDSHLPGYVYLKLRYLLSECDDDCKYNAEECDEVWYLSNRCYHADDGDIHGPALFQVQRGTLLSSDDVHSARCPCRGRHKPLIGRHDTESTTGQTQQLLIMLSTTDVTWFLWRIVSVDQTNRWESTSGECHSHEQKLY